MELLPQSNAATGLFTYRNYSHRRKRYLVGYQGSDWIVISN